MDQVVVSKQAQQDLRAVPGHIATTFWAWVESVKSRGLEETRKLPGYHDEPLSGVLAGSRSIRRNEAYRAYYRIEQGGVRLVRVTGVDKHRYRK